MSLSRSNRIGPIVKQVGIMIIQRHNLYGGSPGPVVMGGDLCSRDCGFEYQHRILDGTFSDYLVVKIVVFD